MKMELLKTLRHEFKYVIPYEDMLKLREKLDDVLTIDRDENGYMIRSLYFDSLNDDDYYDKLDGNVYRKKIRLRIYEPNPQFVKLEMKEKNDIHQLKSSLIIDVDEAKELIKGNYEVLLKHNEDFALKLYTILQEGTYRPKVIIEYKRVAYVTATTTRITFDYEIRESDDFDNFFEDEINYYDLTDRKDVVLEVKFDRFLEPYLSNILASYGTRQQSVSKYMMGRDV